MVKNTIGHENNMQTPPQNAETTQAVEKMLQEVKRKLKPESKNSLIRTICALLIDNYALKLELQSKMKVENENSAS